MLQVAMIGSGAIGASVLELLQADAGLRVSTLVTTPRALAAAQALLDRFAPGGLACEHLGERPADLLVECAGHAAIEAHVLPALRRGTPCLIASIGALADAKLAERIEAAAREGGTQAHLLSGAIGGIDALAAARVGGLDSVTYTGRKPPQAWKGTPAEQACVLDTLEEPRTIFEGSASEAAQLYPKNANVAATLALAGLGMQRTQVRLVADPGVNENVHQVEAIGAFGRFELTMRGRPLAANPKTSALTVYSVVHALRRRVQPISI